MEVMQEVATAVIAATQEATMAAVIMVMTMPMIILTIMVMIRMKKGDPRSFTIDCCRQRCIVLRNTGTSATDWCRRSLWVYY